MLIWTIDHLNDKGFQCQFASHAGAILERDFPEAIAEIAAVLLQVRVPITEIVGSGGGESEGTQRMRKALAEAGWKKKHFEIRKSINGVEKESISHEVDHVKRFTQGEIALEIEWNNKDPFFDRDLENFKRLHNEGAISIGVIVTRGDRLHEGMHAFVRQFAEKQQIGSFADLQRLHLYPTLRQRAAIDKWTDRAREPLSFAEAWSRQFVSDKYGAATTHWRKLMDRVQRGVGNPCPLLLIGLPDSIVDLSATPFGKVAEEIEKASLENTGSEETDT